MQGRVLCALCALWIVAGLVGAGSDVAASGPPWVEAGDIPLAADATSVLAIRDDIPVQIAPNASSPRRGAVAGDQPLPLFAVKRGPGCSGRWIGIGPLAWVCQDHLRLSSIPAIAASESFPEQNDGLPFHYYFVARGGSSGYLQLGSADQSAPDQNLEPGFAVAIIEQRTQNNERYGRSHHGLWIPMRDLTPVRPRTFRGRVIEDGKLDFGWTITEDAKGLTKPVPGANSDKKFARFQLVTIVAEQSVRRDRFFQVDAQTWLHERDVRKPMLTTPPSEVGVGERWIDVDLASQTIVAYEGTRPVYATLVSTGKGAQNSASATPKGVHRIWVKLTGSTMDNLEDEDASSYYSIEDVPYVQFFSKGVGLHGAFWHNDFGRVRSHGCVNLAPLDAQWFFSWTSPHLPAGWLAVVPTEFEPGTIVQVR